MDIIYSDRGIFGIALVWSAGQHFQNGERSLTSSAVMRSRLTGALLACAAIALVFV